MNNGNYRFIGLPVSSKGEGVRQMHDMLLKWHRLGYFGWIQIYNVPTTSPADISHLKSEGVDFIVHAPHFAHKFNIPDGLTEHNQISIDETLETAKHLEAKFVIFHPGGFRKEARKDWGKVEKVLEYIASCSRNGCRILMENMRKFDQGTDGIFYEAQFYAPNTRFNQLR